MPRKNADFALKNGRLSLQLEVYYTTPDWYLDHGKTLTDGSWEFDYAIDPFGNSTLDEATLYKSVLGGESCMWSPHFGQFSVEES